MSGYLSPEPLLHERWFPAYRARVGLVAATYAYASNNPVAFVDVDGLHDTNGCQNGSSCAACDAAADKITDRDLRLCVRKQCKAQDVKLVCDAKAKKGCGTLADPANNVQSKKGKAGSAYVGSIENPSKEVDWCELSWSVDCQAQALAHEMAHTCGWNHQIGLGVPGETGLLPGSGKVQ